RDRARGQALGKAVVRRHGRAACALACLELSATDQIARSSAGRGATYVGAALAASPLGFFLVPRTGLEPVRGCLRGIFVLATAFAAEPPEKSGSFGVWTFSLPCPRAHACVRS